MTLPALNVDVAIELPDGSGGMRSRSIHRHHWSNSVARSALAAKILKLLHCPREWNPR